MTTFATLLTGLSLLVPGPVDDGADLAASLRPPVLEIGDLERWRDFIRPSAAELAAESIPWLPDMVSGLERSETEQRPLLLWLMNGHPLGCT